MIFAASLMNSAAREIFSRALDEAGIEKAFARNVTYERGVLRVCDDLYDLKAYARVLAPYASAPAPIHTKFLLEMLIAFCLFSESIFQSDLNGSHRRTQRSDCSRSARSGVYVRVRQSEVQMIQVKLPAKLNFLPFGHREDFSNPEVQVPQTGPDEDVISGGADV